MIRILAFYFMVTGILSGLDIYTTYVFLEKGYSEANPLAPIHNVYLLSVIQAGFTILGVLALWFGLKYIHRNDRLDESGVSESGVGESGVGESSIDEEFRSFRNFWATITTASNGSLSLIALMFAGYWAWLKLFCVIGNVMLIVFDVALVNVLISPIESLDENLQYVILTLGMGFVFVALCFFFAYRRWRKYGSILRVDFTT